MSEQLRKKMNQYEASPPPAAWSTISARLADDSSYQELSERMHQFEANPPAGAWNEIEEALQPRTKRVRWIMPIRGWMASAATAAAIVALMLGAWWWTKPQAGSAKQPPTFKTTTSVVPQPLSPPPASDNGVTAVVPAPRHSPRKYVSHAVISEEIPEPVSESPVSHRKTVALVEKPVAPPPATPAITAMPASDSSELIREIARELAFNNQYRITVSEDGRLTRTSYLLPDETDAKNLSRTWKKQLKKWRKTIILSGYTPSTGAFPDILELQQLLQEADQ